MKFGSNYASLRIPFGNPLKVIQFRFGEYETTDKKEIALLKKHAETFVIGGGESDGASASDGDKKTQSSSKSGNTRKRSNSSSNGQ